MGPKYRVHVAYRNIPSGSKQPFHTLRNCRAYTSTCWDDLIAHALVQDLSLLRIVAITREVPIQLSQSAEI